MPWYILFILSRSLDPFDARNNLNWLPKPTFFYFRKTHWILYLRRTPSPSVLLRNTDAREYDKYIIYYTLRVLYSNVIIRTVDLYFTFGGRSTSLGENISLFLLYRQFDGNSERGKVIAPVSFSPAAGWPGFISMMSKNVLLQYCL